MGPANVPFIFTSVSVIEPSKTIYTFLFFHCCGTVNLYL